MFHFTRSFAAPLALALALGSVACGGPTPDEVWQRDVETTNQLFRQGRYAEAEAGLRALVPVAERFGAKDLRLATTLNNLAAACDSLGKVAEAEGFYKRALEIREQALGPGDPAVAKSLNNLAAFYQYDSQAGAVEPLLKRALEIREKATGLDRSFVAQSQDNLGLYSFVEGRDADAEKYWRLSYDMREKGPGRDPELALTTVSLGFACMAQGKKDEAQKLVADAAKMAQGSPAVVVEGLLVDAAHPDRAIRVAGLPAPFAEPLARRRAILCRRVFGPTSPQAVRAALDFATLLRKMERGHEAAAVEARLRNLGVDLAKAAASAASGASGQAAPAASASAAPAPAAKK